MRSNRWMTGAIAVDDRIERIQQADVGPDRRLEERREGVLYAVNAHLLAGGESWSGGNLVLSAATDAVTASKAGDAGRLDRARDGIVAARRQLAKEQAAVG